MELISVMQARVGWLFDLGELNSQGKDVLVDLIDFLAETYGFEKYPKSITELDPETKSLAFKLGRYQLREEFFIAIELAIYNDGIVGNSWSSTDHTQAFLEDVLTKAAKEFHLNYSPNIVQRKTFISELTVRYDQPLAALNPRMIGIADKIGKFAGRDFEFNGLEFTVDSQNNPPGLFGTFRLERKHQTPTTSNRYYSRAPLQTREHLEILQGLESILSETEKRTTT